MPDLRAQLLAGDGKPDRDLSRVHITASARPYAGVVPNLTHARLDRARVACHQQAVELQLGVGDGQ